MNDLDRTISFLASTPAAVQKLVENLNDGQLRWKPVPDRFSIMENVCHLRDIESEGFRIRINRMLEESNPTLRDIDGTRLAAERRYNETSKIAVPARDFSEARTQNLERLTSASDEDLARSGIMEGRGPLTLAGLIEQMQEHDRSHLEEIAELREQLAANEKREPKGER